MYDPEKNLKNAQNLLGSHALEDVVSLRLEPEPKKCCCSDCWPLVWQQVNELIYPQGPIEHEGQALVNADTEKCVLVQNESGPELLFSVAASVDVNALINTVIKLISTICSSLAKERNPSSRVNIVKRRSVKGQISEEILLEMDIASGTSVEHMRAITEVVQTVFSKKR